jgi:hypothetical protein
LIKELKGVEMMEVINARLCDLKKGQVLVCEHCGCELTVVKECENAFEGEGCSTLCQFICCNEPMKLLTYSCYELKKGDSLVCGHCSFEVTVVKECSLSCLTEKCCDLTEFVCCGEQMKFKRNE